MKHEVSGKLSVTKCDKTHEWDSKNFISQG